jgi:hypothetical protein
MWLNVGRRWNPRSDWRFLKGERGAREDAQAVAVAANANQHEVEDGEVRW